MRRFFRLSSSKIFEIRTEFLVICSYLRNELTKVAFFYATFPRPTETFVRRELRALDDIGFKPDIYSIWGGNSEWENRKINRFRFPRLLTLFFGFHIGLGKSRKFLRRYCVSCGLDHVLIYKIGMRLF